MRSLRQIFIIWAQEKEEALLLFLSDGSKKNKEKLTARKVLREAKKARDKLYFATKAHHYRQKEKKNTSSNSSLWKIQCFLLRIQNDILLYH